MKVQIKFLTDLIDFLGSIKFRMGSIVRDQYNYKTELPNLEKKLSEIQDSIIILIRKHKMNQAKEKAKVFKDLIQSMSKD